MKTLSLLQPWASLVVTGRKKIETRRWTTAYRGPLLIHASMGRKGALIAAAPPVSGYIPEFDRLPFGAVIGKAMLTDIISFTAEDFLDEQIGSLTLEEKAFGEYAPGRYGWVLEDAVQFSCPVPARGAILLWDFPEENLHPADRALL